VKLQEDHFFTADSGFSLLRPSIGEESESGHAKKAHLSGWLGLAQAGVVLVNWTSHLMMSLSAQIKKAGKAGQV
jgi:hypothetical protein